tara:strand:- start:296 stop:904 length:609 start_codon:yes stop_codon:yes gene_type:complete
MTAKIKLNAASGGGSFSLQAPSSSSNARVMTLPDTADGTILTTTNPKAGNILQVKHTTKSDYFSTGSTSFTDITNFSVAITPASSSSKIFIVACVQYSSAGSGGSRVQFRLVRDSTSIGIGDSNGSNLRVSGGSEATGGGGNMKSATINFLDSPSTTSATTYKIQAIAPDGGDFRLNRPVNDSTASSYHQTASFITVMEVAG